MSLNVIYFDVILIAEISKMNVYDRKHSKYNYFVIFIGRKFELDKIIESMFDLCHAIL